MVIKEKLGMRYRNLSIRYKLLGLYVITAMMLMVVTFLFNAVSTQAIVEKAINQSFRETKLISEFLDGYFYDTKSYSRLLAIDENLQDSLVRYNESGNLLERTQIRVEVARRISSYMIAKPVMSDICILDANLSPVYADKVTGEGTKLLLESMGYTFDNIPIDAQYTGLVELPTRSGTIPGIALVKSVIRSDYGSRIGVIVFYINEELIHRKYTATGEYMGDFSIVDDNRRIISSSKRELLFHSAEAPELSPLFPTGDSSRITLDEQGEKLLLSVSDMPQLHWQVVNHIPLGQITQENVKLTNWLVLLGLGFLVLGVLGNYAISHRVIAPIMALKQVMESTAGDRTMALRAPVHSQDEVGVLSARFNEMMDKIDGLITENNRQQRFAREYEFRLLQAQINPHFLYNTLETIIMLTGLGLSEKSIKATQGLADFYRLTLSHGAEVILIRDEIALTASYLSIQGYRYVEYMQYEIAVDEQIKRYSIPKLTIQPLVENAIYHGVKEKGGGVIRVGGRMEDGDVVITIWDNGMGMTQEKADSLLGASALDGGSQSFGIVSVNTKLKLTYGERYGLAIDSAPGEYTRVTVRIPGENGRERK